MKSGIWDSEWTIHTHHQCSAAVRAVVEVMFILHAAGSSLSPLPPELIAAILELAYERGPYVAYHEADDFPVMLYRRRKCEVS